jgi:hypothetical protein
MREAFCATVLRYKFKSINGLCRRRTVAQPFYWAAFEKLSLGGDLPSASNYFFANRIFALFSSRTK